MANYIHKERCVVCGYEAPLFHASTEITVMLKHYKHDGGLCPNSGIVVTKKDISKIRCRVCGLVGHNAKKHQ